MNAFDIHKNLVAVLGALALALVAFAAQPTYADETAEHTGAFQLEQHSVTSGTRKLRKLLSDPDLGVEERYDLLRALDSLDEEMG